MAAMDLPHLLVPDADAWDAWLQEHGGTSPGVLLVLAKKGADLVTPTYAQAVETALCHGWIDSQKARLDEQASLQRFTRRGPRSTWSQANVETVGRLLGQQRMRPAGLGAVEAARADGRWERAYAGSAGFTVPPDLQSALDAAPGAAEAFAAMNRTNRYAVVFRVGKVLPAHRDRTIARLVGKLADGWVPHPPG